MVNIQKSAKLEKPHYIEYGPEDAKFSFYKMAKDRARVMNEKEYKQFEKEVWGESKRSPAGAVIFVREYGDSRDEVDYTDRWVRGLKIAVNRDEFIVDGEDFTDLIPYAIEHEIHETWLFAKRGHRPCSRLRHLSARLKQFEMAHKDGKLDRIMKFYNKLGESREIKEELDYVYKKIKQKYNNVS